jgi:hypothetical protein
MNYSPEIINAVLYLAIILFVTFSVCDPSPYDVYYRSIIVIILSILYFISLQCINELRHKLGIK